MQVVAGSNPVAPTNEAPESVEHLSMDSGAFSWFENSRSTGVASGPAPGMAATGTDTGAGSVGTASTGFRQGHRESREKCSGVFACVMTLLNLAGLCTQQRSI